MNRTKFLKGQCQLCGGHLEFPAETIGTVVDCPHCHGQTELLLALPPEEPSVSRKAIVWTVIAAIILGLGLAGSVIALKWAERVARQKHLASAAVPPPESTNSVPGAVPAENDPLAQNGFAVSPITLEKTPGTSVVHAVGTVRNTTDRKRFGVRVEFDLLDANSQKLGTARDYTQLLEANGAWQFKALVVDGKAVTAKLASLKEEQ